MQTTSNKCTECILQSIQHRVVSGRQKKGEMNYEWKRENVGEKGYKLPCLYIKLSTSVASVTETATQRSEY